MMKEICYGTITAINKNADRATIDIDDHGNSIMRLPSKIKSAITGDITKLKIGMRISFTPKMERGILAPEKINTFIDDEENPAFEQNDNIIDPWLEVGSYESRFSEKNLGIVARNDVSKYGSLPLYDDYDDESYS